MENTTGYQSVRFQTTEYQSEIGSNHRIPKCNLSLLIYHYKVFVELRRYFIINSFLQVKYVEIGGENQWVRNTLKGSSNSSKRLETIIWIEV